jgi:hypothetical protein
MMRKRTGGGGGGGGGVDFDPLPSTSKLFLEGASREEVETESRTETDSTREWETREEEGQPKKLNIRGEARVPDERKEPRTHEVKALIIPGGSE